jgi:hypothetical protein
MITMFNAMRMSTAKRRIIGAVLACAALLSGCSAVKVGYNNAPTLAWWWLDGYMDFNPEQTASVKQAIAQWFVWHRTTQLPDYADLLAAAQVQVLQPASAAQVCRWNDELRLRIAAAVAHGVPLAAQWLPRLGAAQLAHLDKRYRKSNAEFKDEFLQARLQERQKASVERTIDRAEMLYGRLDDRQRELIAAGVAASPFDPEAWFAERQALQAEVLQTLGRLTAGGSARADPESNLAGLQALAQRLLRAPPGPYRDYQQRLNAYNCDFAAQVHNSTSMAQRQAARDKLKDWEGDLRALAAQPPAPATDAARARALQLDAIVAPRADQPAWSLMPTPGAGLAQPSSASKALSPSASGTPVAFSAANG